MHKKLLQLFQEFVWLLLALLIASAVVYPLYLKLDFILLEENFILVFYTVFLFRLTIFFNEVPWLHYTPVKFILFLLNINLFIFIIHKEQNFLTIYDSFAVEDLGIPKVPLSMMQVEKLFHYFYYEINLSVVTALVLILLFIGRLIHSYWSIRKMRLFDDRLD